ncbi:aldehyde dehydrogenase family protein [Paenibacillus sepulcri]|uniref:aldehyde dehydrogenase family protein n=1 Tax=Paenibacillus sepulcri TaxID=359917 RepID=UPI003617F006
MKERMYIMKTTSLEEVQRIFKVQKAKYSPSNPPSYEERMDRLKRADKLIRDHWPEFIQTLQEDFGSRDSDQIFGADILSPLFHGKHVRDHLAQWMKPERKSSGLLGLVGQKTYILNEPLGVIGIVTPFNAPVSLAFDPAIEALAAGNSVMIKVTESTPRTADFMQKLVAKYFKEEEMAVVTGEADVSACFAALPWDKMVFTGGSEIGKKILAAAAPNLTPVVLELGGKCPAVVLPDADIRAAAPRISLGRTGNAGQVCLAVDYALVPETKLEALIQQIVEVDQQAFPTMINNPKVSSIINQAGYNRIVGYIEEAKAAGCRIIQVNPANEKLPDPETRKIPLTIVVNPGENLQVSKYEIFGPVLSIYSYKHLDEAIAFINKHEKPLGLYVFGKDKNDIRKVVSSTSSGGVTVNDITLHAGTNTMGFGGVGYSGMGRYKGGILGYKAFCNEKAVYEQGLMGRFTASFLVPFATDRPRSMMRRMVGIKSQPR